MTTIVLVIHLILAISLIGVVLLQRSEGGALGIGGGGGGGGGGLMTGRATANLLTRTTGIIAGLFMLTSLALALMANHARKPSSIMEEAPTAAAPETPAKPAEPAAPAVPLAH